MVASVIVGAIAGAVLGLRFNVSIFVPTILIAMAAVILGGIATRHEPAVIALILFGTVASLELGYVAGCVVRPMLPRHRSALWREYELSGRSLCTAGFEVERWRLKRQFSQFEKPVSEYGHPNDGDAQSDGYGRGRPYAMKNFSHGVLLFLFDTPSHDGGAVAGRMPSSAGSA